MIYAKMEEEIGGYDRVIIIQVNAKVWEEFTAC